MEKETATLWESIETQLRPLHDKCLSPWGGNRGNAGRNDFKLRKAEKRKENPLIDSGTFLNTRKKMEIGRNRKLLSHTGKKGSH